MKVVEGIPKNYSHLNFVRWIGIILDMMNLPCSLADLFRQTDRVKRRTISKSSDVVCHTRQTRIP